MNDSTPLPFRRLGDATWSKVAAKPRDLVLIPVGSVEQHGPHLPLDTDTRIAVAVAENLVSAENFNDKFSADKNSIWVAPAINYGSSGEHQTFTGTISIGESALNLLLLEFGRSATEWAPRLLFVNGHGGNNRALASAVVQLRAEGRDVAWLPCIFPDADAHAGDAETSVLLHLSSESVHLNERVIGNTEPISTLMPKLRELGVQAISPSGILGNPMNATEIRGEKLFTDLVCKARVALGKWVITPTGMLELV